MKKNESETVNFKKGYVSQSDVPSYNIENALRISRAIIDNYGGQPTKPLLVAKAMNVSLSSGPFRMMCGASIAYGLTVGGYNASVISVTDLGRRVIKPIVEGGDLIAKREAALMPSVINKFLNKYNNHALPTENIAYNVLEEMGIPNKKAKQVYQIIIETSQSVNFIENIKGKSYVSLDVAPTRQAHIEEDSIVNGSGESLNIVENDNGGDDRFDDINDGNMGNANKDDSKKRRVFITHGRNKAFIESIKKLLKFGELEAVVAIEEQTVSVPVPDKVLEGMRKCGAAIIHVDAEEKLIDENANERVVINSNVLIEIGAAMALYNRRFVLLVKNGIELPSNLQGLYQVRYDGDNLDGDVTIKLLEAINDMKAR
ncbi:nucleotide-binding protein [Candidatus Parcubacteria bacterium]|nr:nucleotide-binding protein [Patescibacteria group bacterium]MBU4309335.1 nucleotide-binding protein [Patescibacteria group bacterium]MBU4432312.1 nucleotide-binding protein [Patescibacteria group bacterium]MBU4577696.1 nucleotide-binding protein [Patescibacteria group bacterium]MCG2697382.1 nucleotide-binding protein [Candidatus Parcubacteria bacterium]